MSTVTDPVRAYFRWWSDPRAEEIVQMLSDHPGGTQRSQAGHLDALTELQNELPVCPTLNNTIAVLRILMGNSQDILFRAFDLGADAISASVLFVEGLVKKDLIMTVMETLLVRLSDQRLPPHPQQLERFLLRRGITAADVSPAPDLGKIVSAALSGNVVLLVEGLPHALTFSAQGWEHRAPEEPTGEPTVRGPKEGFTESIGINLSLVRRRLRDGRLRAESREIGTRAATTVTMLYLAGLAWPELLDEVRRRLDQVKVDAILETGYLEGLISDTTLTPFPLLLSTERPDVVCAEILEGRVALLVDGTPQALVLPTTFHAGMQAAEDYYQRWPNASFMRFIRYLYTLVALLGPSIYIAILTFHHEMLPTDLLLTISAAREGVPFPALVEALLMEFSFEALREAGVRLPRTVGQAVSIVGALVVGEAAVRAGLVSPAMVIVVAITGISSFVIPLYGSALAVRLLRFPMMILAATFGFLGITMGLLIIAIHLASLRSFGVPYMSPLMPPNYSDLKDMMIRVPWWAMNKRPQSVPVQDRRRQADDLAPRPPR